jgi:hypothetical protein
MEFRGIEIVVAVEDALRLKLQSVGTRRGSDGSGSRHRGTFRRGRRRGCGAWPWRLGCGRRGGWRGCGWWNRRPRADIKPNNGKRIGHNCSGAARASTAATHDQRRCKKREHRHQHQTSSSPNHQALNDDGAWRRCQVELNRVAKTLKKAGRQGGGSLQSARLYAARLATSGPRLQGGEVIGGASFNNSDGCTSRFIHSGHFENGYTLSAAFRARIQTRALEG